MSEPVPRWVAGGDANSKYHADDGSPALTECTSHWPSQNVIPLFSLMSVSLPAAKVLYATTRRRTAVAPAAANADARMRMERGSVATQTSAFAKSAGRIAIARPPRMPALSRPRVRASRALRSASHRAARSIASDGVSDMKNPAYAIVSG